MGRGLFYQTSDYGQTSLEFLSMYVYQSHSVWVTKYHLCSASALFDNPSFLWPFEDNVCRLNVLNKDKWEMQKKWKWVLKKIIFCQHCLHVCSFLINMQRLKFPIHGKQMSRLHVSTCHKLILNGTHTSSGSACKLLLSESRINNDQNHHVELVICICRYENALQGRSSLQFCKWDTVLQ